MNLFHYPHLFSLIIFLISSLGISAPLTNENNSDAPEYESKPSTMVTPKKEVVAPADPSFQFAVGANLLWSVRSDYGSRYFRRFEPELVGYIYTELPWDSLWLRHGARLGYSNDQPQMPQSVRIEERDVKLAIEEGILWNWYIIPSLSFGIGYDWRTITYKTDAPMTRVDSGLNHKDAFVWYYLQGGLGIPVMHGLFEIEPLVRWQKLTHDSRTNFAFGAEITVGF